MTDHNDNVHPLRPEALPPLSTVELELANLPDRLDDTMLAAVETIARSPLPPLPACDERHLAMCLRMMLAVLPRQQADEVAGELFVEAYRRHLAEWPDEAITFLANEATGSCKWFPTITECKEILQGWRRSDAPAVRRAHAHQLAQRERNLRWQDEQAAKPPPMITRLSDDELQAMPDALRKIGLGAGWLKQDDDGTLRWADTAA